jgi:hypothetical protein
MKSLMKFENIRDEHTKAFRYDLNAICEDIRRRQNASSRKIISVPLKTSRNAKKHTEAVEL